MTLFLEQQAARATAIYLGTDGVVDVVREVQHQETLKKSVFTRPKRKKEE